MRSRRRARRRPRRRSPLRARTPRHRTRRRTRRRAPSPRARAAGVRGAVAPPCASPRRSAPARAPKPLQPAEELVPRELEEAVLVRADVVEVHVRVARLVVLLDLLDVLVRIRPQRQRFLELVRVALLREL